MHEQTLETATGNRNCDSANNAPPARQHLQRRLPRAQTNRGTQLPHDAAHADAQPAAALTRRVSISSVRLPSPNPKAAEPGAASTKEPGSDVITRTSRRWTNHMASRQLQAGGGRRAGM